MRTSEKENDQCGLKCSWKVPQRSKIVTWLFIVSYQTITWVYFSISMPSDLASVGVVLSACWRHHLLEGRSHGWLSPDLASMYSGSATEISVHVSWRESENSLVTFSDALGRSAQRNDMEQDTKECVELHSVQEEAEGRAGQLVWLVAFGPCFALYQSPISFVPLLGLQRMRI